MKRLSPNIEDIQIKFEFFSDMAGLDPVSVCALVNLTKYAAGQMVWTYTEPGDGSFKMCNMQKLSGLTVSEWGAVSEEVLSYFEERNGKWHLKYRDRWIVIGGGYQRPSIHPELRVQIGRRDRWTCGYCGSKDGPFDIDHVVPLSKGGANDDPSNLMCACAKCNRSKGAKTVSEWCS